MDDWVKWPIVVVVVGVLFFVRRGARSAGYELGKKLRGGREPKPPPPWVVAILAVLCVVMAVFGAGVAAGVFRWDSMDGFDRAKFGLLGVMAVVALVATVRDLVTKRRS